MTSKSKNLNRGYSSDKVRGFSIVEILFYIAILVLMLSIIMNIVISVVRSGRTIKSLRNIENSASISIERITRETRQAQSINLISSTLATNPGRLVLEGLDTSDNPRTVEFYLSSNRLMFAENGVEVGALTPAEARVISLVFRRFFGSNAEGIRTELTIESGTSTYYRSNNFYSSATLR